MTPTKYNTYQSYAQNYKARLSLTNKKAVVHLESSNDISFWNAILKWVLPAEEFDFIPYTTTPTGTKGTGCSQCLIYKDFLDKQMVIAIDSDLRYLLQEPGINAANYILQTYTYSFENHLCFVERLNSIVQTVCGLENDIFDFDDFLVRYSKEIYPLFLMFLYDSQQQKHLTISSLSKILTFPHMATWLDNNGTDVIKELHDRVEVELMKLKTLYTAYNHDDEKAKYIPLGLSEDNAYLYIRGHNLYDLIAEIGDTLCNALKKREKERLEAIGQHENAVAVYAGTKTFKKELKTTALYYSYLEIINIISDIYSIW